MRNAALALVLFAAVAFGWEGTPFDDGGEGVSWNAKLNGVFYDHPLLEQQYGFGVIGNVVVGALGFYIGNAFESGLFDSHAHEGYLSFTGIRFHDWTGPFWGGSSGMLLGTAVTVFFIGDADEEQGSILCSFLGGAVTTAAAFALADWAGVQHREWLPFVPLVLVPPLGSVTGYQIARWFNDRKRYKATETGALLLPPRLAMMPTSQGGLAMRLDAINLSF